ncbi:unnamed protein product, partial [Meganyctiphanes norvegica]
MYVIFPLEELLDLQSATGKSQASGPSPSRAPGQQQQAQAVTQPQPVPIRPITTVKQPQPQPQLPPQSTHNIIQSQQRTGKAAHSQSPSISSSGSPGVPPSTVPSSASASSQGSQQQLPKGRGRALPIRQAVPPASPRGPHKPATAAGTAAGVASPATVTAAVVLPDSSSIIASPGGGTRNLLSPPALLSGRTPPPERANRASWAGSPTSSSDGCLEGQKGTTVGRSSSFRRSSDQESLSPEPSSHSKPQRQNSFRSIRELSNLPARTQTVADRRILEQRKDRKAAVAAAALVNSGVDSKRSSESDTTNEKLIGITENTEKRNTGPLLESQPQVTDTNQNPENNNQESVGQKVETTESVGQKVSVEFCESVVSESFDPQSAVGTVVPSSTATYPPRALRGDNLPSPVGTSTLGVAPIAGRPSVVSRRNQAYLTLPRKYPSRSSAMAGEVTLKDLTNPAYVEPIKNHNNVSFKLVKTVSDFTGQLSRLHEQHAEGIQRLVETYRKENSKLRNERPACGSHMFQAWESLLQEVEVDSQIHSDVAATLARQVSRPLIEKTFYRKIQSRKVFTHREGFDSILTRTEEMLKKCRREYNEAYVAHSRTQSNASLAAYFDAHNAYVQQLHATNGMLTEYHHTSLPSLME